MMKTEMGMWNEINIMKEMFVNTIFHNLKVSSITAEKNLQGKMSGIHFNNSNIKT